MAHQGSNIDKIYQSDPGNLADLITYCQAREQYTAEDLNQLWRDLLNLPVQTLEVGRWTTGSAAGSGPTLGQFISDDSAAPELCEKYKALGKKLARCDCDDVPREIGSAVYYLCIAVCLLRHDKRITHLSDDELIAGFNWMLEQIWLDDTSRAVIYSSVRKLQPQDERS